MNIGVFLTISSNSVSLYRYAATLISALCRDKNDNRYFLFHTYADYPDFIKMQSNWRAIHLKDETIYYGLLGKAEKYIDLGLHICFKRNLLPFASIPFRRRIRKMIREIGIDLMIYPWTDYMSFELGVPYIITVHDLQHKLHPEFKEVSENGVWRVREYAAKNGCKFAKAILVDSDVGKKHIMNYYNIDPGRIVVLPFVPPKITSYSCVTSKLSLNIIKNKFNLPDKFIFYPASFQPHKNHRSLILAVNYIYKRYGIKIPCVFTGPKASAYETVAELIDSLKMNDQIFYLGFVEHQEITLLYKLASMMVMPTFFGPTNLPVVEAWSAGCPVITSDIEGIREQVKHAGIIVDPNNWKKLAKAIYDVYTNKQLRDKLIQSGYNELKSYNFDRYTEILLETVRSTASKL